MHKQRIKPAYRAQASLIVRFTTKLTTMSAMAIAIWLSIFAHAVLLSLHFEPELKKIADRLPTLQVMLVNAKTKTKPNKADVLAQANLDRGGNTEQDRKKQSALPAIVRKKLESTEPAMLQMQPIKKASTLADTETKEQKRVAALEKQAQALLSQLQSSHKVQSQTLEKSVAQQPETGQQEQASKTLNMQDLTAAALEMDRLEALISKQQDDYQKRPRRKFIGARAREYKYAMYVESWRQKVEKVGNLNYPEAAKNLKLYGQLQMTVSIKADGSIEAIELNRSSGSKILDQAARHILELAAPYAKFSDQMQSETDILSITRTWTFTKEDSLATE